MHLKRYCLLCCAVIAIVSIGAQNHVITYKAPKQLPEANEKSPTGIHLGAFNVSVLSHTFNVSDSIGTITFSGDVTTIGVDAFRTCSQMTAIHLPQTLTTIGDRAFYSCTSLTSLTLPSTLTSITGSQAFLYCSKLTEILVEDGNTAYRSEDGVLYNYSKTKLIQYPLGHARTEFTVPATVTQIGAYAFRSCKLQQVTLPGSLKTLSEYAFYGCFNLTSCSLPNTLTSIGQYAFFNCIRLTSFTIPSSVTSIGTRALARCMELASIEVDAENKYFCAEDGVLMNKSKTQLILYLAKNTAESYTIPSTVTTISEDAFYKSTLKSVTIPNSVKKIGMYAFSSCANLQSIVLPNSVNTLGSYVFESCTALETAALPSGLSSIPECLFRTCKNLKSVNIPSGVTSIGKSAFSGCSSLEAVVIPEHVHTINESAFSSCMSLTSIVLPDSLKTIGKSAFSMCLGVTSIVIPDGVTHIGKQAFNMDNDIVYHGLKTEDYPFGAKSVNGYVDGMLVYDSEARTKILGCSAAYTGELTIVNSVQQIGKHAFYFCGKITEVTIPTSVQDIDTAAFSTCVGLERVNMGESLTRLRAEVFAGCNSLRQIVLPNSIAHLEDGVFSYCEGLEDVTLSQSLTDIGWGAFEGCYLLDSILFPATLRYLGAGAFAYCDSLRYVRFGEALEEIDDEAFTTCYRLDSIVLPSKVKRIGYGAFSYCDGLHYASLGDSLETIDDEAFIACYNLKEVVLPSTLETIGQWTFVSCLALTRIVSSSPTPPICGRQCFAYVDTTIPVIIPSGTSHRYAAAAEWELFNYPTDTLYDHVANDSILQSWLGEKMDITIRRTFYKDGEDNTLCLPFSVSASELPGSPLSGYSKLQTFASATIVNPGTDGETLELVMNDATEIEAGKPYIIAWEKGQNLVNPTFTDREIEAYEGLTQESDAVAFCGTLSPYTVEGGDKGVLFVGLGGKLYWPNVGGDIRGMRCYFSAQLGAMSPIRRNMAAYLVARNSIPTGYREDRDSGQDGIRKVLSDGRVVVLRDGVRYEITGQKQ